MPRLRKTIRVSGASDTTAVVIALLMFFVLLFFGGFWYLLVGALVCYILYVVFHIKALLTAMYILIILDAVASAILTLLAALGIIKLMRD
jgi:hypothetical protein